MKIGNFQEASSLQKGGLDFELFKQKENKDGECLVREKVWKRS